MDEKRLTNLEIALHESSYTAHREWKKPTMNELIRLARLGLQYEKWIEHGKKRLAKDGKIMFAKTHGLSNSRVYQAWASMIARCEYPKATGYERYGGAGIKVCEKWKDFLGFLEDMGQPPSKKHSLDRIDNAKGYEKSNCRWIPISEQVKNTRRTIIVEVGGKRMCMKDAAKLLGVSYDKLKRKYKNGEGTVEEIAKALASLPRDQEEMPK